MLTDTINVVSVVRDEWGKQSTSVQAEIRAKVSEKNKLTMNAQGQEVVSSMQIIIPATTIVRNESRIIVKKLSGTDYHMPLKEWQVLRISNGHIFGRSFIELWLGGSAI